jgi:MFS family permease
MTGLPSDRLQRLDRHALVMAVWLPTAFVAAALLHHGFGQGGVWWLAGGFAAVLAGFGAHVIVNAALGTDFTTREVALALFAFALAALALVFAVLLTPGFATTFFWPTALGMMALAAAAVLYMVIRYGPRAAFERFDIIRDNNPRRASRLPHRGGRA